MSVHVAIQFRFGLRSFGGFDTPATIPIKAFMDDKPLGETTLKFPKSEEELPYQEVHVSPGKHVIRVETDTVTHEESLEILEPLWLDFTYDIYPDKDDEISVIEQDVPEL